MASTFPPCVHDADGAAQRALVQALLDDARRREPLAAAGLLETHISYVLLTGRFAYKIKKAVDFGFLDYRTLAQRRRYCAEELRLNRRLAAAIYVALVAIRGTPDAPHIDTDDGSGTGPAPIEYAVKMVEFAQSSLFDRLLAQDALPAAQIDALAERIAQFHGAAASDPPGEDIGSPGQIWRFAAENFAALAAQRDSAAGARIEALADWSHAQYARLAPLFAQRRRDGRVRECHGDLHLGNIALYDGQPLIFDCIEFCDDLRWIDVINEVAFLCMDLEERGRPDLAWRFVNRYLEATGDYAGLPCLSFYRVYRALVRAKIAALRAGQEAESEACRERAQCAQYIEFAHRSIAPRAKAIILMHGVSGSGKTWTAQALLERLGAVRLRSDVERKRLHGLPALSRRATPADDVGGLYDRASNETTYRRLAEVARGLLAAGFVVLIDAACLAHWQRTIFRRLADELSLPLCIVSCRADDAMLRRRLAARGTAGNDASDAGLAILDAQLRNSDPLTREEEALTIAFDGDRQSPEQLERALRACLFIPV